jgi:hypothetical protein
MPLNEEAEFFLGVFGTLGDKVDKLGDKQHPKRTLVPGLRKKTFGTLITPASVLGPIQIICNDRPSAGRMWNIMAMGVYATDAHTVVASAIADLYVGPAADTEQFPTELLPPLVDNVAGGLAVPGFAAFSREAFWAHSGEQPYALVYSAPVSTQLVLRVNYIDYEVAVAEPDHV